MGEFRRADGAALSLLSLGAGVQSTTIALMSAHGDLPPLDGAIFADTGWEPQAVYDHLDKLEAEVLEPAGIPLYRVGLTFAEMQRAAAQAGAVLRRSGLTLQAQRGRHRR